MTTLLTLAHLTDVHLGPIVGFTPGHWNVKRLTGYINWHRTRRDAHQRSVLDRIVADIGTQAPDHVAVTGDLVNIGLPGEIVAAGDWLRALGPPDRVTVVPGNHDIYARAWLSHRRRDPGVARWSDYMSPSGFKSAHLGAGEFPFLRRIGRVALIGVNSAVPTPPLIASGRIGAKQLSRLAALLEEARAAGLFRVVLIHHPPLRSQASRTRGLRDANRFEATLRAHGCDLVLHGHNHTGTLAWREGPKGPFPIVGTPSASLGRRHKKEPLARYNLFRLRPDEPEQRIEMVGRGLAEPGGPVIELERRLLGREEAATEA